MGGFAAAVYRFSFSSMRRTDRPAPLLMRGEEVRIADARHANETELWRQITSIAYR